MNKEAEKQTSLYMTKVKEGNPTNGYVLQILHREADNSTKLIDISELAGDIIHTTSMIDNPSKLTFFVQKDPNGIVQTISNGDKVYFKKNGYGIFCGYVFTVGMDATEVFKITAYDAIRYLKNEDNMLIKNMTVSQIFKKICTETQLPYRIIDEIDFVPAAKIYSGKTYYSILKECLQKAEIDVWEKSGRKNSAKYIIRDNYGTLELLSAEKLITNIEIGQESLLCSYQFETSIDKGTYNSIKVVKKANEKSGKKTVIYQQPDNNSIQKWGLLQKVFQADENLNEAQAKELAKNLLKAYCKETKTLSLSALGVMGMNAGISFKLNIPSLGQKLNMCILEATHKYTNDFHTMDLSVNANDLELYFKD